MAKHTAGAGSDFKTVAEAVADTASVLAQLNLVSRVLFLKGYDAAKAMQPELYETSMDGSKLLLYVWRDSPFGDDVVLSTGPSFTAKLALGKQIPATAGVGVYVQAVLNKTPRSVPSPRGIAREQAYVAKESARTMRETGVSQAHQAKEAQKREAEAHQRAEMEASKRREAEAHAREAEAKAREEEAKRREADAHRRAEEDRRRAAEEASRKPSGPSAAETAAAERAELAAMLKGLLG